MNLVFKIKSSATTTEARASVSTLIQERGFQFGSKFLKIYWIFYFVIYCIKNFRSLKSKWEFSYICPTRGETKKNFISGIIVVNFFTSEKHVIETFRELAIFIEIHNFSYLKRNDILKFQQF